VPQTLGFQSGLIRGKQRHWVEMGGYSCSHLPRGLRDMAHLRVKGLIDV